MTLDLSRAVNSPGTMCLYPVNTRQRDCEPTLLLTSAESPKAGPLLKCVDILHFCLFTVELSEEGFKNGEAG